MLDQKDEGEHSTAAIQPKSSNVNSLKLSSSMNTCIFLGEQYIFYETITAKLPMIHEIYAEPH